MSEVRQFVSRTLAALLMLALPALALPMLVHGAEATVAYRDVLGLDSRTIVWVVAELHLMFGAFVLGVPIFAVIVELVGSRTGDQRFDKLAHEFTKLLTAAFSTTAALGGLLAFLLIGLYPGFMVQLGTVMHESFYVYASLFFAEAFTLYLYYYGWERMSSTDRRESVLRKGAWVATAILGVITLGLMLFGGGEVRHLKEHGNEIAARADDLAEELTSFMEQTASNGGLGQSFDKEALENAVSEAASATLASIGEKAVATTLSVLAEEVSAGIREEIGPGGVGEAERAEIARAAREKVAGAVDEAAELVTEVAASVLKESPAENISEAFSAAMAEAAAAEKIEAYNRASNVSAGRWFTILKLSIATMVAFGFASYFTSLKALHLFLGLLLNIFGVALMMIANSWATYMMAPNGINEVTLEFAGTTWGSMNNVLWNPINIHRFIANVVFGGFVVAAYAAVKFLGADNEADRAHYDWMGYIGNFVGMAAVLPLPFAGYYLGREIYSFSPIMGNNMMGGVFSWSFIIQAVLIGMLFISANYYLWVGMQRIDGAERYRKYIPWNTAILIFSFAVWLTPHNLPLSGTERALMGGAQYHPVLKYFGLMPAKNAVVNFIILSTFFSFLMYRRANKGEVRPFSHHGLLGKGVVGAVAALCIGLLLYYVSAIHHLDLSELSIPLSNRWVMDWTARALMIEALAVVLVVALTLSNRGVLGQFIYFGITAFLVTGFLGVWGFVTMVNANAFLRNIAVCQVLMVLTCLTLNTTLDVFLFRGAPEIGKIRWGQIPPRSQYALILCCVSVVLLMGLMGYIRSALREDWHIFGVMRDTSLGAGTPTMAYMAWVVGAITLLFFALVAFVFWLGGLGDSKASVPQEARP